MKLKNSSSVLASPAIPGPQNIQVLLLSRRFLIGTCSVKLGQFKTSQAKKEEKESKPNHWEALQWFLHLILAHFSALAWLPPQPPLCAQPQSFHQCYHLMYLPKVHKNLQDL